MGRVLVRVQPDDFDVAEELDRLAALPGVGAVAQFIGVVRDRPADDPASATADAPTVVGLELEHYPGMTETALQSIAERALAGWPLAAATILHRVGALTLGDRIVLTAAASPHRHAAQEACAFMMDRLKTDAPFWKRELMSDGAARWVAARATDDFASKRWDP